MNFNVNDYVYVKLTAHGRKILRQNHEALGLKTPYREPQESQEFAGYVRFQLWELMQEFGHEHVGNGLPLPFETNMKMLSNIK